MEEFGKYHISNDVKDCIRVTPRKLRTNGNLTILTADVKSTKSIGYCGCKSALLSYSIYSLEKVEGHYLDSLVGFGVVSTKNKTTLEIVVNADSAVNYDSVKIDLTCKGTE